MTDEKTGTSVRTVNLKSAMLTAAELYAARAAGYEPVAALVAVVAISMGARGIGRGVRALFTRGQITVISQTSQHAHDLALEAMEAQAKELGADMVIINSREVRDLGGVVEVECDGTALKKVGDFTPMAMATATN